jgi:hypothetical protein
LIVTAVQALSAGGADARLADGGWRQDKEGAPVYEFWSGSGGRIRVHVDAPAALGWADVESYSALTLDTAMTLLAGLAADPHRASTAAPRLGAVRLGAPAVLNAKGYKRFGAERDAFGRIVEAEMAKVLRLRFDIVNYPAFDPTTRKWSRAGICRSGVSLLEVADESSPADPLDCTRGASLRFGAWAEHWLHAGGALWVSPLPQAILRLDHRENRGADPLAKKIALLLALNWGAARRKAEIRVDVRALLRRIGELRRPGAEPLAHAGRLADRFEEALMRLSECEILSNRVLTEEAAALRAANRRWFEQWLDGEVLFRRPDFLRERDIDAEAADVSL